jgi:hypothetical protein
MRELVAEDFAVSVRGLSDVRGDGGGRIALRIFVYVLEA